MDLFDLTGKFAVVTGASSGLGADAALAYAEAGADVALLARRLELLDQVKNQIEGTGRRAMAVACDVTDEKSVEQAFRKVKEAFGRIDILFNNAGIAVRGGVDSISEVNWDKCMDTNVKGVYLCSKQVIPMMKEQKYGKIVNTASISALVVDKQQAYIRHAYNASKAAVVGLTRAMAGSYARYNITVNAIGPGLFETEMTRETLFKSKRFVGNYNSDNPSGRPGRRGELNGTVIYLSSDASSYVQGQLILVDGGAAIV